MSSQQQKRGRAGAAAAQSGFSLVEMVVVMIIIGLLLIMTAPNWVRARQVSNQKACISNLARIDAAERQWALDNKLSDGATVTLATDLVGSSKYLSRMPSCPSGGTYPATLTIGTVPTCTVSGHVLSTGN